MCGRYRLTTKAPALEELLQASFDHRPGFADGAAAGAADTSQWPSSPRYNAAPTQLLPIVHRRTRDADGGHQAPRVLRVLRWGLVVPGVAAPLINARSETVADKPAFRDLVRGQRCLVPADGFYEWRGSGRHRTPYLFSFDDDRVFCFGGLWSGGAFTILTTAPNDVVAPFHDRMPLVVAAEHHERWLADADLDVAAFADAAGAAAHASGLGARKVSPRLGDVTNDDAGVLLPDLELF